MGEAELELMRTRSGLAVTETQIGRVLCHLSQTNTTSPDFFPPPRPSQLKSNFAFKFLLSLPHLPFPRWPNPTLLPAMAMSLQMAVLMAPARLSSTPLIQLAFPVSFAKS